MSSGGAMAKTDLPPVRIAVIGGGITGLAAAYRLKERLPLIGREFQLHLLESTTRVGGTVRTLKQNDFLLECGPDSFLTTKRRGVGLCDEIGLRRQMIQPQKGHARSFIARGKKLIPVPEGFYLLGPTRLETFLFSGLLSFQGKLRMLKEMWVAPRPEDSDDHYDESLASFVRRRLGQEALDRIAQPLVAGIYAADPESLSLRATFPQFLAMEKNGGILRGLMRSKDPSLAGASGARYNLFATLKDGLQGMTDQLEHLLTPAVVKTKSPVRSLIGQMNGKKMLWQVNCENGQVLEVDALCLALPSHAAAALLQSIDPKIAQLLNTIPYGDSATIQFGFRSADIAHSMHGYGFVVPAIEKRFISACTFSHQKFAGRAPKGHALLRAFVGGSTLARFTGDDEEMQRRVLADLKDLLGVRGKPLFSVVARYRRSMPQFTVGHRRKLTEIKDRARQIPGLALAGNWLDGVGLPDCIEAAEAAADTLWSYLSH